WVFWTGVIVMGLRLLIQLVSLLVLHWKTEPVKVQQHDVRRMDSRINPFSFFRNIYVNPEMHTPEELEAIVLHEKVHVSQWHSADVMMSEVNNVFYWFNPGAWLMKTAVKENLEFITDRKILRSGVNATAYQYSLVKVSTAEYAVGLANNFNFSHLKNRIRMMNKTRSSRLHLYRYGVLAGVVCGALLSLNYTKAGTVVNHVVSEVKDVLEIQPGDTTTPAAPTRTVPVEKKPLTRAADTKSVTVEGYQTVEGKSQAPKGQAKTIEGRPATAGKANGIVITKAGTVSGKLKSGGNVSTTFTGHPVGARSSAASFTQGSFAGLAVRQKPDTTHPAWKNSNIVIRYGPQHDTSRHPLIVVDGEIYKDKFRNTLKTIDPNSIESITVLKDQSARAIYGDAGIDGVIFFTTKAGKKAKDLKEVTVTGYPKVEETQKTMESVVVVGYAGQPSKEEVVVTGYPSKRNHTDSALMTESLRKTKGIGLLTLAKNDDGSVSNKIYPNPTTGIVNLAFTVPKSGDNFLEVKDMNGRSLYRQSLKDFAGSYRGQIDLSRYPAGSYIVRMKLSGSEMSSVVVKQ
ncbi:MAG: M56 family metallopeptidase, partial [Chitinophaga sp.]